jgi:hypothetical protein
MPYKICLVRGNPPRLDCTYIPVLLIKWPRFTPEPFRTRVAKAFRDVFKPQPDPWLPPELRNLNLSEETIRDARILATVDALASQASPAVAASLRQAVVGATDKLNLPQGANLTNAA